METPWGHGRRSHRNWGTWPPLLEAGDRGTQFGDNSYLTFCSYHTFTLMSTPYFVPQWPKSGGQKNVCSLRSQNLSPTFKTVAPPVLEVQQRFRKSTLLKSFAASDDCLRHCCWSHISINREQSPRKYESIAMKFDRFKRCRKWQQWPILAQSLNKSCFWSPADILHTQSYDCGNLSLKRACVKGSILAWNLPWNLQRWQSQIWETVFFAIKATLYSFRHSHGLPETFCPKSMVLVYSYDRISSFCSCDLSLRPWYTTLTYRNSEDAPSHIPKIRFLCKDFQQSEHEQDM